MSKASRPLQSKGRAAFAMPLMRTLGLQTTMRRRNRSALWNPEMPVDVSPEEYEREVVSWLQATEPALASFAVHHRMKLEGASGEYEFDAVAKFEVLNGATFLVLVECKRHSSPVKRDVILALEAKLRDVGAHKGMIFSTAGFQRGALEYAAQ
jgi:restriction system protein